MNSLQLNCSGIGGGSGVYSERIARVPVHQALKVRGQYNKGSNYETAYIR